MRPLTLGLATRPRRGGLPGGRFVNPWLTSTARSKPARGGWLRLEKVGHFFLATAAENPWLNRRNFCGESPASRGTAPMAMFIIMAVFMLRERLGDLNTDGC